MRSCCACRRLPISRCTYAQCEAVLALVSQILYVPDLLTCLCLTRSRHLIDVNKTPFGIVPLALIGARNQCFVLFFCDALVQPVAIRSVFFILYTPFRLSVLRLHPQACVLSLCSSALVVSSLHFAMCNASCDTSFR